MKLLLLRHAERESLSQSNPLLTARGVKQAEALQNLVQSGRIPPPHKLWASPKIRTQMTLAAVSKAHGLNVQIRGELDERMHPESPKDFRLRVGKFLQYCAHQEGTHFLCTHLDWVEVAMLEIASDTDLLQAKFQHWHPGQYMYFSVQEGLWHLEDFGGLDAHP